MSELNRFDLVMCGHSREIEECDNGDYMPYEDHEAKVAKLTGDIKVLRDALSRVAAWDELSLEFRFSYGSNGQRDFYKAVARKALAKTE